MAEIGIMGARMECAARLAGVEDAGHSVGMEAIGFQQFVVKLQAELGCVDSC